MYLYSQRSLPRGTTVLQEGYRSPPRGTHSSFATFVFSLHIYIYCACDHSSLVMLVHHICMSPALLCKSSIQSGNAEQCALAFIHLLSSSCTSYFYNISYMFVLIVNASVWWYSQLHSECILSDPGPIIIIIIDIVHVLFLWCNSCIYFTQSMFNHCI